LNHVETRSKVDFRRLVVSAVLLFLLATGPHALITVDERQIPPKREPRGELKRGEWIGARTRTKRASSRRRARSRADAS
jgi:hypothetical protein